MTIETRIINISNNVTNCFSFGDFDTMKMCMRNEIRYRRIKILNDHCGIKYEEEPSFFHPVTGAVLKFDAKSINEGFLTYQPDE